MRPLRRVGTLAAVVLALCWAGSAWARGFHHGGGFHHGFGGPRVFIGGAFGGWPYPYAYPYAPYPYPYYAPYPYPYPYPYSYPPPPPDDSTWSAPPPAQEQGGEAESAAPDATYGLVQLHGVPDGAQIDLDGRFWLTAGDLDHRWLALPQGRHELRIRVGDANPVERRIDVAPGKTQVVRVGPLPRSSS